MSFTKVLGTEVLKLRRAWITWLSLAFYGLLGFMAWFVLWIVKNPGAAADLGLLGQKASFASAGLSADWPGLLTFIAEMNVAGGMIIFSIVVIWLFGREYVEGTAKNMLALPTSRASFIAAKFFIALVWCALLTAFLIVELFAVGSVLGLGSPPPDLALQAVKGILLASLLVFALQPLVAWMTVLSRGYLAPFGYTVATLLVANLMARTGWARWFPWSALAVLGGMTGPPERGVAVEAGIVIGLAFVAGCALTVWHEYAADNAQ